MVNSSRVEPAFGHWLAGFTDGEGSFLIQGKAGGKMTFHCRFRIQLRDDDLGILEDIRDRLGVGTVISFGRNGGNRKPQAAFQVTSKPGCVLIRDFFREYPLRAKKKLDFEIWSEGLEYWVTRSFGDSWDPMVRVKARLEAGRAYSPYNSG